MNKIKELENEIKLTKELLELKQLLLDVEEKLGLKKQYIPYPVYPIYPQPYNPYPIITWDTGSTSKGVYQDTTTNNSLVLAQSQMDTTVAKNKGVTYTTN